MSILSDKSLFKEFEENCLQEGLISERVKMFQPTLYRTLYDTIEKRINNKIIKLLEDIQSET